MEELQDIRDLSFTDLEDVLLHMSHPKYRAKQVYDWIWKKDVTDFDQMGNVPKAIREELKKRYTIPYVEVDKVQTSTDGTVKFGLRLADGQMIEAVLIPVERDDRYTVCVSSQVGCSLSCKFCATGTMGRIRNLKAQEILDQYRIVDRHCIELYGRGLTNVVYMGMGEPLLNYAPVVRSLRLLTDPEVQGISPRRITVSTAGVAKMITRLADEGLKINLALSLHAADDTKRSEIMAINDSNGLDILRDALYYFYRELRTKISFEYIALRDFNDSDEDAERLATYARGLPVMVNIIEYNTVDLFDWQRSEEDRLDKFAKILTDDDVLVTIRRSRGKDIDAACGQLALDGQGAS